MATVTTVLEFAYLMITRLVPAGSKQQANLPVPVPSFTFYLAWQFQSAVHYIKGQTKVSLLGVDALWDDCTFIPADWGS